MRGRLSNPICEGVVAHLLTCLPPYLLKYSFASLLIHLFSYLFVYLFIYLFICFHGLLINLFIHLLTYSFHFLSIFSFACEAMASTALGEGMAVQYRI